MREWRPTLFSRRDASGSKGPIGPLPSAAVDRITTDDTAIARDEDVEHRVRLMLRRERPARRRGVRAAHLGRAGPTRFPFADEPAHRRRAAIVDDEHVE